MSTNLMRWLMPAALCMAGIAATAQTHPSAARRPDPLDAGASLPARADEPRFRPGRRGADDPAIPWREANDTVARIGGWRAYAREAHAPSPGASATARPPAPAGGSAQPARHGHAGHGTP